jgi:NAD(P)H-flavin reductase
MTAAATQVTQRNPWVPEWAAIRSVHQEVRGIATYDLAFCDAAAVESYRFQPGQFNMLYVPGIGEAAISISSDPHSPGRLLHTIRVVGNVTQALARRRVGDVVGVRGPFGSHWPVDTCRGADLVIACGGIGLAPLRPVLYHVARHRADYGRAYLLYGARTPADLLFRDEYAAWEAAGIEVSTTVDIGDDAWRGNIGVVPMLFYSLRLEHHRTRVLSCGPEVMMRYVIFESLARKIRPHDIYISMERNMSCALGFCGHCQLGPAFVCKDGPVFTYREMEPYLHVEDL